MSPIRHTDFVLIGGGIMSATLAILLLEKYPNKRFVIYERLPKVAEESSEAWNNAGTGHSGYCELNYTPMINGDIDLSKAIKIAGEFKESLDFWFHCAQKGYIQNIDACLHAVPHCSLVMGQEKVDFLRRRWELMRQVKPFEKMQFSTDPKVLEKWFPLIMTNRKSDEAIAATRVEQAYDVNFGAITDQLFDFLSGLDNVQVYLNHEVRDIDRKGEHWLLDLHSEKQRHQKMICQHLFIGAGGAALPLLEKANIKEAEGYGGFPVSGLWLRCMNREIIEKHHAKVYGMADEGAPPMSVPHLDSRVIEGKRELLFGPFAGYSTKFLKHGSIWDWTNSIELDNIRSMLGAGFHNISLVSYLIEQATQTPSDRINQLRKFYPDARKEDWKLVHAGQRVQIIKPDRKEMGKLEFGTEVIISKDQSLSALLGASPGASTSYAIMNDLIALGFGELN